PWTRGSSPTTSVSRMAMTVTKSSVHDGLPQTVPTQQRGPEDGPRVPLRHQAVAQTKFASPQDQSFPTEGPSDADPCLRQSAQPVLSEQPLYLLLDCILQEHDPSAVVLIGPGSKDPDRRS